MKIEVAISLREADYDAVHTSEIGMKETKDAELLEYARQEQQIIITKDKGDFTRTLALQGLSSPSLILIRKPLADETPQLQLETLLVILADHSEDFEQGVIITIMSDS